MNFSKITLFAAALLAVPALSLVADDGMTIEKNYTGDIVITGDSTTTYTITTGENSYTLTGSLLNDADESAGTLVITGGGSLTYNSSLGLGYYTDTYSILRGETDTSEGSAAYTAWQSVDSLWNSDAYSGSLVVSNGTTLNLEGQIVQYNVWYMSTPTTNSSIYREDSSAFYGVSDITLTGSSTISFEYSTLNLCSTSPSLGSTDPQSGYSPTAVLALNFLNNLYSDASSTIVIGTDSGSVNRIFLNTDDGNTSTVGILRGNGRFYTTGEGAVAFIGVSELNSGSNADTTGNTWVSGNLLADIVLANSTVYVGVNPDDYSTTDEAVSAAVDNVFANATAVQLGYVTVNSTSPTEVNTYVNFLGSFVPSAANTIEVSVYGDQVFNNFQSLWIERTALMSDPDISTSISVATQEPVSFCTYNSSRSSYSWSTGTDSSVYVTPGSVLTINQDYGRDGWYTGKLFTTSASDSGSGLIVKTGEGAFLYTGTSRSADETLAHLRIEEGTWVSSVSALSDTYVTLSDTGRLELLVSSTSSTSILIQAVDESAVLAIVRSYTLLNDLTSDTYASYSSSTELSDSDYRSRTYGSGGTSTAAIQFTQEQAQFYGTVSVEDGITLILGSEDGESGSIFSSAQAIQLNGLGTEDASLLQNSVLQIYGTQLVKNLYGVSGYSEVNIAGGGTLVLVNTDTSFEGTFGGTGNLVKLGSNTQTIRSGTEANANLSGTVVALAGSVYIEQENSDGYAGLVLAGTTSAAISGDAQVGALIGESGATLSVSGTLTVGRSGTGLASSATGSYLATAEYGGYSDYFSGTSAESVLTSLQSTVNTARAYQSGTGTSASTETKTTTETEEYLKDAGGLATAFKKLYATTGTTESGVDVFTGILVASGNSLFSGYSTVYEWLQATFTESAIEAFISSDSAQLSSAQEEALRELAQNISSSSGIYNYLTSAGDLDVEGWNAIVAAAGLEYLKYVCPGLENLTDESLYSFITYFDSNDQYEFILTSRNATLISETYGLDSSDWFVKGVAVYDNFEASFGVDSLEFAGIIAGSGNLIKTGAESLILTGVNSYSGATQVLGGELDVDWDAIRETSGVYISSGALLTINADGAEIDERVTDLKSGYSDDTAVYYTSDGVNYGYFFSDSEARLSGAGVILKLGDGNVDLYRAIYDVEDGATDFTGTFLVGEGTLRATVNATARAESGNDLAFNIAFSASGSTDPDQRFELVLTAPDTTTAQTLEFSGSIMGVGSSGAISGTFSFDGGSVSVLDSDGNVTYKENNVLVVTDAANVSVGTIEILSGTLQLGVVSSTTLAIDSVLFDTDEDATFAVDLSADATMSDATLGLIDSTEGAPGTGNLLVSSSVSGGATLTLTEVSLAGIKSITLTGTANLVLETTSSAYIVDLTSLSTDSGTALTLNSGYTLKLSPAVDESCVVAGTLAGDGTIEFSGEVATKDGETNGMLVIGSEDAESTTAAFSGTIVFSSGTIEFVAGEGKTVTYSGLNITDDSNSGSRILAKDGEGTVEITYSSTDANSIAVVGLEIEVLAGTLEIAGGVFVSGDTTTLPDSIYIASAGTFAFVDFDQLAQNTSPASAFSLDDINVSGSGTLSFEAENATSDVYISVESNIFSESGDLTFTGVVNIGENVVLMLGSAVTDFSGFSGEGTVYVEGDTLTVHVDTNADGGQRFSGTITGNLAHLTVVGDGALNLTGCSILDSGSALTEITIGSEDSENGGVGVGNTWAGTIYARGAESRVIVEQDSSASENYSFAGTVVVGDGVSSLVLLRSGTLELGENAVSDAFNLTTPDGGQLVLDGSDDSPVATLGNVAGTSLTLTNLSDLETEVFELVANENENGYALIFSGADTTTTSTAATAPAVEADSPANSSSSSSTVWSKDISGDGGIAVTDNATLELTASTLTYTGETFVESGSTLIYGGENMASYTSQLYVEEGGTVEGGVSLIGDSSSVVFEEGATFVYTGTAIGFTGTATVVDTNGDSSDDKISVNLTKEALSTRGQAISLFEYIGSDSTARKNLITLDKIDFSGSDEGVYFYLGSLDGEDTTITTGKTQIYVATDDLSSVDGVSIHKGFSSETLALLSKISTPTSEGYLADEYYVWTGSTRSALTSVGVLADAIIKTSNADLSGVLNTLSPLSFSSMIAIPQSGFLSDIAAVTSRIEQRRYDNYAQFIWETSNDWEYFVQLQSAYVDSDNASDTRTYDFSTYGAIAGMDVKLGPTAVGGFALSYDYGNADIHDSGGKIHSHDMRFTGFFGKVFAERFYLDTGAQFGISMFETDRKTILGDVDGNAIGFHTGVFANVGAMLPLFTSEDEKTGLYLMPYVGVAASYYIVGSFDEDGSTAGTDTDAFDAPSLRGTIGASLALKIPCFEHNSRLNLDIAYTHEFMDTDVDIDTKYPELGTGTLSFEAPVFAEDVFSIGPRFVFDLDDDSSIYAGYHFEISTDSDVVHSANIGYRQRF